MDLTHDFTVPASVDDAWAAFNDLERVAPCFPGASLTSYDGESFEGLVKVKLGPISLQYAGTGSFVERDEAAHRAVIEAKGKDKRGNGTASATITASLKSAGDSVTDVTVKTDLTITGKPAQFGRGVMQDVSDKLLAQFAGCLETKLGESSAATPSADEPTADASTAAEPAAVAQPDAQTPADLGTSGSAPSQFGTESGARATPSSTRGVAAEQVAPLDMGATIVPVLLKRYAPHIIGGVVALWLLRRTLRRR